MIESESQSEVRVTYRAPWSTKAFGVLVSLFLVVMSAGLTFVVVWGGLALLFWPVNVTPPGWWQAITVIATLLIAVAVIRYTNRSIPSRIVLTPDEIEIGGLLFRRRLPYDQIRVVALRSRHSALDKSLDVRITPVRGFVASITLRDRDAHECLRTVHELSDAAAIDVNDVVLAPINPELKARAHQDVLRVFRMRERGSWLAAVALGLYSLIAAMALIFWATPQHAARAWFWVICGPGLAMLAVGNALRNRRRIRELQAGPTDGNKDTIGLDGE